VKKASVADIERTHRPSTQDIGTMMRRRYRNQERGQGLVEYAIILVLVAIVVIVVGMLLGLAVQRIYGLAAAGLGARYNSTGTRHIVIDESLCIVQSNPDMTGLWIIGRTNIPFPQITGSTERAVGTGIGGDPLPISSYSGNGPEGFAYNPLLDGSHKDESLCPKLIVVQATDGTIALSPVTIDYR
jgi:pilus assembly protein Flp/PilA